MRLSAACALLIAAALPVTAQSAHAASAPPALKKAGDMIVSVGAKRYAPPARDCTPTNGPFGFYGNIWCQPPNERSYLRNLGASWPQKTPPALAGQAKRDTSTDW